ncbi:hypothetical protein CVT26_001907 [Gymnopilus dilepis]|uniref:Metallo-beta-lactamase domain-containing protein n=1 Tax=Gymnopilus dilepis TaxID=231916 RepID=A0A409Y3Y0_9AGAR|nr:hypothetical protein CVT26_001907 [Gymnopilus dilepis]
MTLPTPAAKQAFCGVSALDGGALSAQEGLFITNARPGHKDILPSLCFLLQHSENQKKFIFDLGVRPDTENYPPMVREKVFTAFPPEPNYGDVVNSLSKGEMKPEDLDFVCLSHLHWDHTGDTHAFEKSTFVVGADSRRLLENGYPQNPDSFYASDLLPEGRTQYIMDEQWKPIGPFPRAFDFYGDGSLYIVDSPGHADGHVNVLARTSADGAWIYLAADSAHHWKLITGEADIQVGIPGYPHFCIHHDKAKAEEHIEHIREVWKMPRVRVLLAHDSPWYAANRGGSAFWPGKIESL